MPELPEVETVRAGLARFVLHRPIASVQVTHPRSVRRHAGSSDDFGAQLTGVQFASAERRGKYLWLPLARPDGQPVGAALVGHLGMSGQLLVQPPSAADERHLHVRITFADDGSQLRFVDQRTFGGFLIDALVPAADAPAELIPAQIAHIARDPIDDAFDDVAFVRRLRSRTSEVKRALLDQSLISGVGNIYADESLWRAKISGLRPGSSLATSSVTRLLDSVREVLGEALVAGGTSFDSLYVNVNGESGYFDRSLSAYGREGQACPRCGAAIRRSAFMNRSSFSCPRCQPVPRLKRA